MSEQPTNQDISYQPTASQYSFSSEKPAEKRRKLLNTFFTLVIAILGFSFLFFVVLVILNYFRIINLSFVPGLTKLPTNPSSDITSTIISKRIPETNQIIFTLTGKLYGYDQDIIKVKFNQQTINFKFIIGQSYFYTGLESDKQPTGSEAEQLGQISGFLSDLEQEKNIGKQVIVEYTKDKNGNNVIQTIILNN